MREITVPPAVPPARSGGLADSVFERARSRPGQAVIAYREPDGGDDRGDGRRSTASPGAREPEGRWRDVTAEEFRDEVLALAKGLLAEGVRFGDRVAVMSRTRYEWTLFDYALWTIGAQSVPVYPTSSSEQVLWMFTDAAVSAAIVEHEDHAMTIGAVVDRLPLLRRLWQLDAGAREQLTEAGRRIDTDVVERHRMALTPDTVATVVYTSGSEGRPKGCVLTHANLMAECDNIVKRYESVFSSGLKTEPTTLLVLPLAHVYGRMVQVAAVRAGVKLGHQPEMTPSALLPALREFRPTFLLAVPYLFERIHSAARRRAESEGRLAVFEQAEEVAERYAEAVERKAFGEGPGPSAALRVRHQLMDRLVYSRLRQALGGRLRYAVSGGSSMDRRLGLFFDGAGVRVFEGWGLTETTATLTGNPPERPRFGTVGMPIPGTTVALGEDGEVWVRGGQVFQGYLSDPAATARCLREGWFATGDLGALDEYGYLTITGRKKDVLVTSSGKTVNPAVLEGRVRTHPLVAQCVVIGNDRPFVSALVTLDPEAVSHWLAMRRKPAVPASQLVHDADLEHEIRRAVIAANTQVSQAESIRTFRILGRQFTVEDGLLTPSLKLRRRSIEKVYQQEIDTLYRR
ncbi:AMP-dependent synthetase/ligase [Streptomyces alkaliterrae]|uniref:AMP-binding protein n=1 Tax=Streptomyces alkaliterrae TaxID=2213162 RepID=A0A5P0YUV2_9ACTN|nr:AMP-dependent synthetase/ligase [Streptomyces alkaliterrae]MBB1257702.1 long-chain fatty acid--CoA ligase [Streptomyces alkaliterrae]MQS04075.1 AMP-binding protein [Streptomyces alkaliterrae]